MKVDLIGTHRTDLDTKCEIVWVTIKIQGSKDVTIGAFYRSPQFGDTYDYMKELRESINKIKRTNSEQIWLAGDFNLPDIDWDLLNTTTTIKDWNSLPNKLATIKEPHKFKLA